MRIGRSILTIIEQRLAGKTAPRFPLRAVPRGSRRAPIMGDSLDESNAPLTWCTTHGTVPTK
jgi:hypothetical protein